jgi:hypothetical protein
LTQFTWKEGVTIAAALISLSASIVVALLGTNLALRKERRQLLWSKRLDRFFALEELAGELTSEITSYRYNDVVTQALRLDELHLAAGRFSRYDSVRRRILDLHNVLNRMLLEKKTHGNEETNLRIESVVHLRALLRECDRAIKEERGEWLEDSPDEVDR